MFLIEYVKHTFNTTSQPVSKQACKTCNIMTLPYSTKPLERPSFLENRHVDPNKAHRSDLCSRCKSGQYCAGRF